jgi:hypothetical protein
VTSLSHLQSTVWTDYISDIITVLAFLNMSEKQIYSTLCNSKNLCKSVGTEGTLEAKSLLKKGRLKCCYAYCNVRFGHSNT